MARQMDGLVAWITGGGTGLGAALAEELAGRGARVAVSGRRADRLQEVVARIEANGGQALAVPCDVTDEAAQAEALQAVLARFGRLDIAVANAGFGVAAPFWDVDAAAWRRQLETNVVGVAITLRTVLPELRKTRGRAVVVSSVMGRMALAGSAAYCASKHALCGLCDALWMELQGTGVTLTNILPGLVASEIAQVDNQGVFRPDWQDKRPRQLLWPTDRAARVMADAIWRRKREYVFTAHGKLAVWLGRHAPWLLYGLLGRAKVRGRG